MKYTDPRPNMDDVDWGGSPPITAVEKPWRTMVLYADIDTGEFIISNNPYAYWVPIKKEVHVYETKKWRIREIVHLCERTRQYQIHFGEPAEHTAD